jgi:hypothetical protein
MDPMEIIAYLQHHCIEWCLKHYPNNNQKKQRQIRDVSNSILSEEVTISLGNREISYIPGAKRVKENMRKKMNETS